MDYHCCKVLTDLYNKKLHGQDAAVTCGPVGQLQIICSQNSIFMLALSGSLIALHVLLNYLCCDYIIDKVWTRQS